MDIFVIDGLQFKRRHGDVRMGDGEMCIRGDFEPSSGICVGRITLKVYAPGGVKAGRGGGMRLQLSLRERNGLAPRAEVCTKVGEERDGWRIGGGNILGSTI